MLLRTSLGLVLAFFVLLGGYVEDDPDHERPCSSGSSFVRSLDTPSMTIVKDDVFLFIGECRIYDRDRRLIGRMSYPAPQYYVYAVIAFALPFAVGGIYRRFRPRRLPGSTLLDRMFPQLPPRRDPPDPPDRRRERERV